MSRLCLWYRNCLRDHPVKTQTISSGLIWAVGDVAAQTVTHATVKDKDKELKINWRRVGLTSLYGFGFVGTVGHFWYQGLDRIMIKRLKPNSARFIAAKVAIDGFIYGPLDLLVFFTYIGLSAGKSVPQVKEDIKRDFVPALMFEGSIWPFVQVVNFRYIPVRYQLLYVNTFCLIDSCFLSWFEQQEDAQWKKWLYSCLSLNGKKNHGE